jgi:hypothetical protein
MILAILFGAGCASLEEGRCFEMKEKINGCFDQQTLVDDGQCSDSLLEAYDHVMAAECSELRGESSGKADTFGDSLFPAPLCAPFQKSCGTFSEECCDSWRAKPQENEFLCIEVTEEHCGDLFEGIKGSDLWTTDRPITRFGVTHEGDGFGVRYAEVVDDPVGVAELRVRGRAAALGCTTYKIRAFCEMDWPNTDDPEYCEMFPDDCEAEVTDPEAGSNP